MNDIMIEHSPADWKLYRLGQLFRERKEKGSDKEYPPLSVTKKGILPQLDTVAKSDDSENRKIVRKGDFVINSRSDRKGSGGISSYNGSVSLINTVLEPLRIHPRFCHHLLRSTAFQEEFYKWGHGIVADLWTTRFTEMQNIKVRLPKKENQCLIANFLDKKITKIDLLITKIERKIELLREQRISLVNQCVTRGLNPTVKMKNSGIEWIGKIPKHWVLKHLGTMGAFAKGKNITKDDLTDSGVPVILYSHLYTTYNRIVSKPHFLISESLGKLSTRIPSGTFMFTSSGETIEEIGKSLLYNGEDPVCVGGDMILFRIKNVEEFDTEFLSFVFNSEYVAYQKSSNSRGEIVVHIYEKQIRAVKLAIPPVEEQRQICDILKKNEKKTSALLDSYLLKIELLKEYRQSLISSVVTGKMRITKDMI